MESEFVNSIDKSNLYNYIYLKINIYFNIGILRLFVIGKYDIVSVPW